MAVVLDPWQNITGVSWAGGYDLALVFFEWKDTTMLPSDDDEFGYNEQKYDGFYSDRLVGVDYGLGQYALDTMYPTWLEPPTNYSQNASNLIGYLFNYPFISSFSSAIIPDLYSRAFSRSWNPIVSTPVTNAPLGLDATYFRSHQDIFPGQRYDSSMNPWEGALIDLKAQKAVVPQQTDVGNSRYTGTDNFNAPLKFYWNDVPAQSVPATMARYGFKLYNWSDFPLDVGSLDELWAGRQTQGEVDEALAAIKDLFKVQEGYSYWIEWLAKSSDFAWDEAGLIIWYATLAGASKPTSAPGNPQGWVGQYKVCETEFEPWVSGVGAVHTSKDSLVEASTNFGVYA